MYFSLNPLCDTNLATKTFRVTGGSQGQALTLSYFTRRSIDTKRTLYHRVTKHLELCGIPQDHIKIVLREHSRENWGILGGKAGYDVDVGYNVDI